MSKEKKYIKFAHRLKQSMKAKELRQVDLVERTKISKASISQYLSGDFCPKNEYLISLAKVLEVDPLWLSGIDLPESEDDLAKLSQKSAENIAKRIELVKKIYFKLDDLTVEGLNFIDDCIDLLHYRNTYIADSSVLDLPSEEEFKAAVETKRREMIENALKEMK
ncbi:helix-turn-helix domain-containing protein [Erysipelatoclostridium ramosum]|jgi:transcriptional regulator with XRE-family HTH domain|uniref:helix-turn-helix domain-containing protein n=1 Tax=Thomasclavelia ramosa TaxID=1547 RepID=UPI00189E4066|nr:helix-turn-helix domain-containing protein [Thomasclavelia ramosa]MDB7040477.1 helix-turn-helix domain-containing protein [Thomasclavelia ramosa]